jgi:hypothetical protein
MRMSFSIDGGRTWIDIDGQVRVLYDFDEDGQQSLLVNCTEEGVIMDAIDHGIVLGTRSDMAVDLFDALSGE